MSKGKVLAATLVVVFALLTFIIMPATMQAETYEVITAPFNLSEGDYGYNIPLGSIIYHKDDGRTEVRGPDNVLVVSARNSEASLIPTPAGLMRATDIYQVPSGSRIVDVDINTTEIYLAKARILTIIDQRQRDGKNPVPTYDGWIESSDDWAVDNLDNFNAYWLVPSDPPDPNEDAVNFLFNAIEPDDGLKIIQPVLEWNWGGSGDWTGKSWVVCKGKAVYSDPIDASEDDEIKGIMAYADEEWLVVFWNKTQSTSTSLITGKIDTDDLAVFCAFEGYDIENDDDVPGDTTFYDMVFQYDSSSIDITWVENIRAGTGLTELNVVIDPNDDSIIILETAN